MAWIGRTGLWRPLFWAYALLVFTLTHTPGLDLGTKVRVDLVGGEGTAPFVRFEDVERINPEAVWSALG